MLHAEDADTKPIDNIGFMKNPPQALNDKFPMCDAFLNVVWIDKEKKLGYTNYDALLMNDKKIVESQKKKVWALVNLDDKWPSYTLDIYPYVKKHQMSTLFDLVKNGKARTDSVTFQIRFKNDTTVFYGLITPVIADHKKTICISYPDNQKAWIIEGKTVKNTYSKRQLDQLHLKVIESGDSLDTKLIDQNWILDINFDNQDDFVSDVLYGSLGPLLYSNLNHIYQPKVLVKGEEYIVTFPPRNTSCKISNDSIFPITTDGKNYYINNKCNLTQMTTQSKGE